MTWLHCPQFPWSTLLMNHFFQTGHLAWRPKYIGMFHLTISSLMFLPWFLTFFFTLWDDMAIGDNRLYLLFNHHTVISCFLVLFCLHLWFSESQSLLILIFFAPWKLFTMFIVFPILERHAEIRCPTNWVRKIHPTGQPAFQNLLLGEVSLWFSTSSPTAYQTKSLK